MEAEDGLDRKLENLKEICRLAENGEPGERYLNDFLRLIVYLHRAGSFADPQGWKHRDEIDTDLGITRERFEKAIVPLDATNLIEYALMSPAGPLMRLASVWYSEEENPLYRDARAILKEEGEDLDAIEEKASRFSRLITSVRRDEKGRYVMNLGTQVDPEQSYLLEVHKPNGELVEIEVTPSEIFNYDDAVRKGSIEE